jgi:hypothetical protein
MLALISACSKSGVPLKASIAEELILPEKPIGILPANAETCSDYKEVAGATDKAVIFFSWSTAENANNYLVQVFESGAEVYNSTVSSNEVELTLDKGKTYSWKITAKNNDGEAQSSTLSFTTPGQPIGNFTPYAAQIYTNYNGATSELGISWTGGDEDGDTLTYDIKVTDSSGKEIVVEAGLSGTTLAPVLVNTGETYTIQITSKDNFGNYSISTHTEKIND